MSQAPQPDQLRRLVALGDLDGALRAGLMDYMPGPPGEPADALLLQVQQRLRNAWDARERYRARQERLARRAAEREIRRHTPTPEASADANAVRKPALPPAAAAALARAKARAAERGGR